MNKRRFITNIPFFFQGLVVGLLPVSFWYKVPIWIVTFFLLNKILITAREKDDR